MDVAHWISEHLPSLVDNEPRTKTGRWSKFEKDLSWVRFCLFRAGFLEPAEHGIWALSKRGYATHSLSDEQITEVIRYVRSRPGDTLSPLTFQRMRMGTIIEEEEAGLDVTYELEIKPTMVGDEEQKILTSKPTKKPTLKRVVVKKPAAKKASERIDSEGPSEKLFFETRISEFGGGNLERDTLANTQAKKLAARPQNELPPDERHVQCKIFKDKSSSEAVKRLETHHHYRAQIHIGPDIDEAALCADEPFDESQLPPSDEGHDLQIAFCPLDTRAGIDGIVPAMVKTIHMPKQGNSGVAEFTFDSGEDGQAFRARILILHHNRILQTLMLAAPELDAEFALRQENMVSPAFASSASEVPTDLALVINDNSAGIPGITAITAGSASFSEPAGLNVTIDTLKSLLSKANIDTAGEDLKLDHPKLVGLMIQLANHGVALMRELERQINMPAFQLVARVQVVEARSKAYLPVEFVYTGKPPKIVAKLCPNAKKALAAADGSVHAACEHANDPQHVCPAAFWGFSKCIERHPFGQSEQHVFSIPQPGADTLAPFNAAVLAASTRVLAADLTGVNGVEPAIAAVTKDVRLAKSWGDWKQNILTEPHASLLVLLPHTDNSPDIVNMPALEIQKEWLTSVDLDSDYVQPANEAGPGPIVLLLGCSTALTDIAFLNFVREFKGAGASIVLGTLATVHGTHASRFIRALLGKMKSKSNGRPFDEILLEVKREMLAEGEPFVLSLAAYGHSSWRIQT